METGSEPASPAGAAAGRLTRIGLAYNCFVFQEWPTRTRLLSTFANSTRIETDGHAANEHTAGFRRRDFREIRLLARGGAPYRQISGGGQSHRARQPRRRPRATLRGDEIRRRPRC